MIERERIFNLRIRQFGRIAFGVIVLCCSQASLLADGSRPNIVFILVDDLGWSDLACYGHQYHRTPNIDRLASQGLRFTDGYAPAPICSASRASILTGKSPARLHFEFVTKGKPGRQRIDAPVALDTPPYTLNLPLSEVTLAELLKQTGYATAFFGKWHLNRHYQGRYLAWDPQFGPRKQGFEFAVEDFGDHPYSWKKKDKQPDLPPGKFPEDTMINSVVEHIGKSAESDIPFFLMVSSFYVHTPVKNRCRWLVEKYEDRLPAGSTNREQRLEYAAFVETLDHHVGTILDAIENSQLADETLVFFMSDNGGHPEFSNNAPLRGSKWNLYEGGIRVPMIARWPGVVARGRTSQVPTIGYDLLPTFAEIAGVQKSDFPVDLDGVSLVSELRNAPEESARSLIWHFPYYHPESTYSKAIDRIGVGDFATSKTKPQSAIRRGRYKLLHFAETEHSELYDLRADVSEQNDLSRTDSKLATDLLSELNSRLDSIGARRAQPR